MIRLSGILGFRHTLEKFLFFEANDHFTAKERRAMLYDLDNFCASLLGDRLADVRKVSGQDEGPPGAARITRPRPWHPLGPGSSAGASNGAGRDEAVELAVDGAYRVEVEPREDERGFFAAWCAKELQDHGCEGVIADEPVDQPAGGHDPGPSRPGPTPRARQVLPLHRRTASTSSSTSVPTSPTYLWWAGVELAADRFDRAVRPALLRQGLPGARGRDHRPVRRLVAVHPRRRNGIRWDDPALGIDWPIADGVIVSEKDMSWADLRLERSSS